MVDIQKINNTLIEVYTILKFTPDEIKKTANDLAKVQEVAVSTELLKSLTEDELKTINESVQKSDEEKMTAMGQIVKNHEADEEFKTRAMAAVKGVLDEHIAYLKTRGDDGQKAAIGKILAELEQ